MKKDEQKHNRLNPITHRVVGQQIGVIIFGDGNESAVNDHPGKMVIVDGDHATIHKMS